jgi:hypothetical protein
MEIVIKKALLKELPTQLQTNEFLVYTDYYAAVFRVMDKIEFLENNRIRLKKELQSKAGVSVIGVENLLKTFRQLYQKRKNFENQALKIIWKKLLKNSLRKALSKEKIQSIMQEAANKASFQKEGDFSIK